MEYEDLLKILEGDISHIDSVNIDDIALYETRVTITPDHVRKMLFKYLADSISAEDLIRWARFICMRTEYSSNYLDDDDEDYYEDMFYVIQRLSTPEIDGEVNKSRVRLYLSELKKYP